MANRSFILAVVLLVGIAILFSGMGSSTGKYVNSGNAGNSLCAELYDRCVQSAYDERTNCFKKDQTFVCQQRFDNYIATVCKKELVDCIR